MNGLMLHIGKDAIKMEVAPEEESIVLSVNDQKIPCKAADVIALGRAFVFILACVSPDYASRVLKFDPSEIESKTGGRVQ